MVYSQQGCGGLRAGGLLCAQCRARVGAGLGSSTVPTQDLGPRCRPRSSQGLWVGVPLGTAGFLVCKKGQKHGEGGSLPATPLPAARRRPSRHNSSILR